MVTRETRHRVERRADRQERMEKAQERRFIKGLTDARDTLDSVIEQAERGSSRTLDTLEDFSEQMNAVYGVAERMEEKE